jgi:hypothetical protein
MVGPIPIMLPPQCGYVFVEASKDEIKSRISAMP